MSLTQPTEFLVHPRVADPSEAPSAARYVAAARSARGTVSLSLHDSLEPLAAEWRRFEETADCTVFQSYAWQSVWQKHIGGPAGVQPAIVVGRERDRILFIFPFAIERGRFARRLMWHASDLCDYNGPLLAPDFAEFVDAPRFLALFDEIGSMMGRDPRFAYDAVLFDKMPEMVGGQANPFMALSTTLNPSGAYATPLLGDWEAFYMEKRSSATRRRDRTKRKRLAEIGEIRFVTPEAPEAIAANLAALVEQKTQQFAKMGVENIFARPGLRDFFLDIATNPAAGGIAHVSRLEVGTTVAAANLGLVFRGRYYHILASYDAGPASRFGPGMAHLHDLMRYAIQRKCGVFDFTIGDESYKREWSDGVILLHDHRSSVTLMGFAAMAPSLAIAATKRFIKQTPLLWALATRVRKLLGSLRGGKASTPAPQSDERDDTRE